MATIGTTDTNRTNTVDRDVDSTIALVAYTKTPFYTGLRMEKAIELKVEKLEDVLGAAARNAHVEGANPSYPARNAPAVLENRVQRFEKSFQISEDLEAIKQYGIKSEFDRNNRLNMEELARDIEWACLNETVQTGTGPGGDANRMNGILQFTSTANDYDFSGAFADTNHITYGILLNALQAQYEEGADPDRVLAPPSQKRKISAFQGNSRVEVNLDAASKTLNMIVDVLETDFGVVMVMNELFLAEETDTSKQYQTVLVYDSSKVACKTLRPLMREEMAKTGDARNWRMTTSKTILPDSRKAFNKIEHLTKVALTTE